VPGLSEPIDARVMVLVDEAIEGRLSVCAGAGLSGDRLPHGPQLAKLLRDALRARMAGYVCADGSDLIEVADAADELPGGRDALQRLALALAPFDVVTPGPQHELLALLVCEGGIRLLLTNWDTCVERATNEDIKSIRDGSEAMQGDRGGVLKVHGCATRPSSLLITSAQLADAPLWTQAHFSATLTTTTMVFLGIGDIATYAQRRITQLATTIPHARARVVSRSGGRRKVGRQCLEADPPRLAVGPSTGHDSCTLYRRARPWMVHAAHRGLQAEPRRR